MLPSVLFPQYRQISGYTVLRRFRIFPPELLKHLLHTEPDHSSHIHPSPSPALYPMQKVQLGPSDNDILTLPISCKRSLFFVDILYSMNHTILLPDQGRQQTLTVQRDSFPNPYWI